MINHLDVYKEVAEELGYPVETVTEAYREFWKFIRTKIEEMPFKERDENEDISDLRPSFNIPSIGKLTCRQSRFNKLKETYKIVQRLYGRDSIKEDGDSDIQ